jgi:hypothetical protein
MPEINFKGPVYKVTLTEYDDGAQRPWGERYFDCESDAKEYCNKYNSSNPGIREWYVRADYTRIA